MKKWTVIFSKWTTFLSVIIIIIITLIFGPKLLGWTPLIVQSGSMEPAIPTGSVMYYDSRDCSIELNEIVTYRLTSSEESELPVVTHRVIRMEKGDYITKGDSNEYEDFVPVRKEQILGTYLFHIPKAGFLISKLNRRLLIVAAIWLFLLNILSILCYSMFKEE